MNSPIYLDYNATTPLDPMVFDAMEPYLKSEFGNPSSQSHVYGWNAKKAVDEARKKVATVIGANANEIIFTSGATESNNLAILGFLQNFKDSRPHLITSNVEHKAVLDVCRFAESEGKVDLTVLDVNKYGQISPEQVANAINENTVLVSLIMANNEIGSVNPIAEIGKITRQRNVFLHTDCAQAVGKMAIDVDAMNIDMLSISGHKVYGPKGVGALYVRKEPRVPLCCMQHGGAQECGIRPGTINVPGVVGLGRALEICMNQRHEESARLRELRDGFIQKLQKSAPQIIFNGHPTERLCNNINFSMPGIDPEDFSLGLSGLALSSGSACNSAEAQPSHVLKALGHSDELARASLRVGLGRTTTPEDLEVAAQKIIGLVTRSN